MSSSVEAVFVPGRPARDGVLALWNVDGDTNGTVELALPTGKSGRVRRVRKPAQLLSLPAALPVLLGWDTESGPSTCRAWALAALAGLGLIARGRLLPAVAGDGTGTWRVGPLDPSDHGWLREFVATVPPQAHALPIEGTSPLRIRSAGALVREFWDALADHLVRTPAAHLAGPAEPFAGRQPVAVPGATGWLVEAARADQAGAKVVLRVQPTDDDDHPEAATVANPAAIPAANPGAAIVASSVGDPVANPAANPGAAIVANPVGDPVANPAANPVANPAANPGAAIVASSVGDPVGDPVANDYDTEAAGAENEASHEAADADADGEARDKAVGTAAMYADDTAPWRAVLQLRSVADPSLLVDIADFWHAPAAVLSRFGEQAEADLMLGLRRGARAWPPLEAALKAATPTGIDLGDADLDDLLDEGAEALDAAGLEVLWPKELFGGGLAMKATASTPTPQGGVETTLSLQNLVEFSWQPQLDGEPLTKDELAALADAKRPFIRLRGRWIRVDKEMLERLRRKTKRRLTTAEALAATLAGELEADGELVAFSTTGQLADLAAAIADAPAADHDLEPAPDLLATLRPYQRRGLSWLSHLTSLGLGGCLADDMGLGKTLQLIALHLHRRELGAGPTLVICPTTLLGTWQREFTKFAPTVPVRRYHGAVRDLDDLEPDEVVLTSYGVARRDTDQLADAVWGLVVADEAQHAKNPLSRTARAIRKVPAVARVALTGTPVENRLSELWSILDWTMPGLLGTLPKFQQSLAVPVERYRDADATARLARITRPFLLRRRKSDPGIAPELPPKTESDLVAPLTSEQASLYQAVVDETMAKIRTLEGIQRNGFVLGLLTTLKQICNHPAQYLHENGPIAGRSGKLAALDELLDVILDEGESVLIFSQYVEMCALLEKHLAGRGVRTQFLHGGTPVKQRDRMVADFQAGEVPIFLLSLKAGGVGLTLTQASHVIHYDRWWNPAVEDQATDRAYRIGQDKPVQVHRLMTEGTLEDRIGELMQAKRELADAVVDSGEGWLTELSNDALADLVQLGARE
ncbi:DEAD/DEAH box helicase [Flindersiella endophytica]